MNSSSSGREPTAGRILVLAVGHPGPAAHVDGLAGHEVRLVRGREDHRPGDLLGAAEPLERHVARGLGDHRGSLPHLEHALRLHGPRGHGGDGDAVLGPFGSEALRQHVHRRLGRRVAGHTSGARAPGHRADIDDLARALPDHHAPRGLREEKDAGEIRLHHGVPLLAGKILEGRADPVAGIVDEEIDAPERLHGSGHGLLHLPRVADVAGEGESLPPLRAHLGGHRLQRREPAAAGHDVRPDLGQLDGDGAPDALAGPRHDGDAVTESVGGKTHEVRAYQLPREDRSLNDRARRGHDTRDLDLLAIDQGRHLGRDLVLPVIALVDSVVEALALRLALESPDPHVDALVFLTHEAAKDDHAHLDLERDDLLLHALDPALALAWSNVILPELEEHARLPQVIALTFASLAKTAYTAPSPCPLPPLGETAG